jgi:hypothetical protein
MRKVLVLVAAVLVFIAVVAQCHDSGAQQPPDQRRPQQALGGQRVELLVVRC